MPDSGSAVKAEKIEVIGYPIGILSRCPVETSNHVGCLSCRGDGTVLPKPQIQSFDSKRKKRLFRRAVSIF